MAYVNEDTIQTKKVPLSGMELVTLEDNFDLPAEKCIGCLGELTDAQASQIVINHFKNLPLTNTIAIGTGLISGNYDPVGAEGRKLMEELCTVGAVDKIKTGIEKYYPYLFVTVGSIGATILGFKIFKHKK